MCVRVFNQIIENNEIIKLLFLETHFQLQLYDWRDINVVWTGLCWFQQCGYPSLCRVSYIILAKQEYFRNKAAEIPMNFNKG